MAAVPVAIDPYKNFRFRVKWDGRYVAGISKVSALKRSTEIVRHREGGNPGPSRKAPGETEFDSITLERGVTHDPAFEEWANKVWSFTTATGTTPFPLQDFRKDIRIELHNEFGQVVLAYNVFRCWVSEYTAIAALDVPACTVVIESIRIENEGWQRDTEVAAPSQP